MISKPQLTNDRGVSPVVGVALLIAMTVILAAVIGAVVLGIGMGPTDSPQATLSFETESNGDVDVILHHQGGDTLHEDHISVRVDGAGDVEAWDSDNLTAGDRETIVTDAEDGTNISVVWEDPGSDHTTLLEEYEV